MSLVAKPRGRGRPPKPRPAACLHCGESKKTLQYVLPTPTGKKPFCSPTCLAGFRKATTKPTCVECKLMIHGPSVPLEQSGETKEFCSTDCLVKFQKWDLDPKDRKEPSPVAKPPTNHQTPSSQSPNHNAEPVNLQPRIVSAPICRPPLGLPAQPVTNHRGRGMSANTRFRGTAAVRSRAPHLALQSRRLLPKSGIKEVNGHSSSDGSEPEAKLMSNERESSPAISKPQPTSAISPTPAVGSTLARLLTPAYTRSPSPLTGPTPVPISASVPPTVPAVTNSSPAINRIPSNNTALDLQPLIRRPCGDPTDWTFIQVIEFISCEDPSLKIHSDIFTRHEIDGKAMLLLSSQMMMKYMGLKLGPALKICNIINKVRTNKKL